MPRPFTLFTGRWADLPIEDRAATAGGWGFDGLELASWGDHFEVDRALEDDGYCRSPQELLERNPDFSPSEIAFDAAMQKAGS